MSTITSVLSTPPLTVPNKKAESFDWTVHCKYILEEAGLYSDDFVAEIHELNQMRNRCLGCGSDRIGLQLHLKYYSQIADLTNRFILVDVPEGKQSFIWSDAYDSSFQMEQNSVAFEKANILFNSAAILSQQAAACPTATPEDLNSVYSAFQQSASILFYIKEHFLHPPLHDISKPSLEFLAQLMLAQAQEAAAKKAVLMQQQQAKIIARLWHSSSVHFASALKYWYAPNAGTLRENVQDTVPNLIDQKLRLSSVLSLYYSAVWGYGEERVGEAIARLSTASAMCKEVAGKGEAVLARQFSIMESDILGGLLAKWEKENSLIFHQPLPTVLPEIEPASLVSFQSIEDIFVDVISRDMFEKAVPRHIKGHLEKFREEGDKLARYEEHLLEKTSSELMEVETEATKLAQIGSIKEYLNSRLEDEVKNEAESLLIGDKISDLHSRTGRLKEILKNDLEMTCDSLKLTSKSLFDISLNSEKRRDLIEQLDIKGAIFESLLSELEELESILDYQTIKSEQLVKDYSAGNYGDMNIPEGNVEGSTERIVVDTTLIKPAQETLTTLKQAIRNEDPTDEIIRMGRGSIEQVIQKRLKVFDPLAAKIETEICSIKKEIDRVTNILKSRKQEASSNKAFQAVETEISLRKGIISSYRNELKKKRHQLEAVQVLKSEVDSHREEYKKLVASIEKQPSVAKPNAESSIKSNQDDQALKDREYLLKRLSQLGITPDNQ